jgi:hypothetical protein
VGPCRQFAPFPNNFIVHGGCTPLTRNPGRASQPTFVASIKSGAKSRPPPSLCRATLSTKSPCRVRERTRRGRHGRFAVKFTSNPRLTTRETSLAYAWADCVGWRARDWLVASEFIPMSGPRHRSAVRRGQPRFSPQMLVMTFLINSFSPVDRLGSIGFRNWALGCRQG